MVTAVFISVDFSQIKTIVAKALNSNLSDAKKKKIYRTGTIYWKPFQIVLINIWIHQKHNFYVQREDYIEPKSIEEVLNMLDINVGAYDRSLEISGNNDFQVHLRLQQMFCK